MTTQTLPTPTTPTVEPPPMPNVPNPPVKTQFGGMTVMVEHPAGSTRTGIGADGKPWATVMKSAYGYMPNGNGEDGEGVDCYLGPDENAPNVHVVHQNDANGNFDEDKAILGVNSVDEAKAIHQAHVPADRYRSTTVMPKDRFAAMLTKAEPGSAHWKKKNARAHGTTAMLSAADATKFIETLIKSPSALSELGKIVEMARAKLARCPACKSHDVTRLPANSADEGPMDQCKICGKKWPLKPGTLTADQHSENMARQNGVGANPVDPQSQGTTDSGGWTEDNPPVAGADGTPVDDDPDKDDEGQSDADQLIAGLHLQSRTGRRVFSKQGL
jgi:hypothetical protein